MITITIASTGRPQKLKACIDSIPKDIDAQIKIGCRSVAEDIPLGILKDKRIAISVFSEDPVPVQNALGVTAPIGSHVLPISDDIVFAEGAIQNALKCLEDSFENDCGVVGFKIANMDEKNASPYAYMLIGSVFFTDILKRKLFWHEYKHFYADTELGNFAKWLDRFIVCNDAEVMHFHPSAGYPADYTHTNRRHEKWKHDYRIYEERLLQDWVTYVEACI
jgi:hypothetical protein